MSVDSEAYEILRPIIIALLVLYSQPKLNLSRTFHKVYIV